jgi:ABC-type branched-subunit amino acid transport system ATPase component
LSTVDGAPPVLDIAGLNAFYGKSQVIFNVDLRVGPGEAVAVLGRNGAGKTTALMAIAGVVTNRCHALRLGGEDISHLASFKRVRKGLSLVPSGSRAFPNLTVNENLELVRRGADGGVVWSTDDAYRTFPKLAELKGNSAGTLSGGERQMLAVARAMLAGPKLLMLDEPSEGLAPMVVKGIAERLATMRGEGIGILLTEQNYRLALEVADRVYFLEKGQVLWQGNVAEASDPAVIGRYLAV